MPIAKTVPTAGISTTQERLRPSGIGVMHITFFVIAAAAPLTVVTGGVPLAIGLGSKGGVPAIFLIAGLIYLLFAVGYSAMAQHIGNAGAFYTYIVKGLGRPMGVAGALLALLTYNTIQIAVYGGFGYFTAEFFDARSGMAAPWWIFSLLCILAVQWVGVRHISFSGRVLGLILLLEAGIVLLIDGAILLQPAARPPLEWSSFLPGSLFGEGFGVSLVFVIAAYIGFEATAIFSEEAIQPKRTVPRATYLAVALITLFYAFCSWAIIQYYGVRQVAQVAHDGPANLWVNVCRRLLGNEFSVVLNVLMLTSMFACVLAFHNSITRYFFSLAREGILWRRLCRLHGRQGSPYLASRAQTAIALAVIALAALAGLDPYNVVFAWLSGIASLAILALQVLASLAIFRFFQANPYNHSLWVRQLAPAASALLLAACYLLVAANISLLTGTDSRLVASFPWLVLAVLPLGAWLALRLKARQPEKYRQLGLSIAV